MNLEVFEVEGTSALLKWDKPYQELTSKDLRFDIYLSVSDQDSNGQERIVLKTQSTQCWLVDLKPDTQYRIRVQAMKDEECVGTSDTMPFYSMKWRYGGAKPGKVTGEERGEDSGCFCLRYFCFWPFICFCWKQRKSAGCIIGPGKKFYKSCKGIAE